MKIIIIIISFVSLSYAFAAVPSVEGLFRGAGNNDITAEGVQFSYIVSKELEDNEVLPEGKIEKVYVKITTSKEKNRDINLIQEVFSYDGDKIGRKISLKYIPRIGKFLKETPLEEKRIFLSIMLSLARNESGYISEFLKDNSPDYIDNKQAMDKERVLLINEYKKKLIVKKEMKELEIEEEQLKKYREALAKSLNMRKENVKLLRRNKNFFWDINFSNFNAKFNVNSHKLKEVLFTHGEKSVLFNFNDYILFNGLHVLPRSIHLKINEIDNLKIVVNQLRHFKNYGRKELVKRYEKLKESNTENLEVEFPVVF